MLRGRARTGRVGPARVRERRGGDPSELYLDDVEAFPSLYQPVAPSVEGLRQSTAGSASGTSTSSCRAVRGSHSSQRGRYQFQSPSSFIDAGSSTARTIVASIRTAVARPTPNCFRNMNCSVPKIEKTPNITSAALVTTPAVDLIP